MQNKRQVLHTDVMFAEMFEMLDELHTAASEGELHTMTSLNRRELVGWLRDLVYTAQETIAEIEQAGAHPMPESFLRLVEKIEQDKRGIHAVHH